MHTLKDLKSGLSKMKKKKEHKDEDIAGFRSMGEAAHHVGKRMTQQTVPSKKQYTRKTKHKKNDNELER